MKLLKKIIICLLIILLLFLGYFFLHYYTYFDRITEDYIEIIENGENQIILNDWIKENIPLNVNPRNYPFGIYFPNFEGYSGQILSDFDWKKIPHFNEEEGPMVAHILMTERGKVLAIVFSQISKVGIIVKVDDSFDFSIFGGIMRREIGRYGVFRRESRMDL